MADPLAPPAPRLGPVRFHRPCRWGRSVPGTHRCRRDNTMLPIRCSPSLLAILALLPAALPGQIRIPQRDPQTRTPPFTRPAWAFQEITRLGPDGNVNPGFADHGMAYTSLEPRAMCALPDGRLLIADHGQPVRLQRLLPDGRLDTGFGDQGTLLLTSVPATAVLDLGVDPNGRAVLLAQGFEGSLWKPVVVRLDGPGLDSGFANRGFVKLDWPPMAMPNAGKFVLAIDPVGRPLVGGASWAGTNQLFVVRVQQDGTLDQGFGTRGFGTVALANQAWTPSCLRCDARGRVYLVANALAQPLPYAIESIPNSEATVVFRLQGNGMVDPTWANQGAWSADRGATFQGIGLECAALPSAAASSTVLYCGGYVVTKENGGSSADEKPVVFGFLDNGTPDPAVGSNGRLTLSPGIWPLGNQPLGARSLTHVKQLFVDPKGRLVPVGFSFQMVGYNSANPPKSLAWGLWSLRCTPAGGLEKSSPEYDKENWQWIASYACPAAMDGKGHLFVRDRP